MIHGLAVLLSGFGIIGNVLARTVGDGSRSDHHGVRLRLAIDTATHRDIRGMKATIDRCGVGSRFDG
jgi:hypothetical protein